MADQTYADVTARLEDRRSVFAAMHREMAIDELFILGSAVMQDQSLLQYFRGFPPGFLPRIPSIAADAVARLRNQIIVGETPDVSVRMPGMRRGEQKDKKARDDREALEQMLKAQLSCIERYGSVSPLLTAADHAFGLGAGILAYPLVADRLQEHPFGEQRAARDAAETKLLREYQRMQRSTFPYDVRAVSPMVAFWDPYHEPFKDMILEERVYLGTYAQRYPHLGIQSGAYRTEAKLVSFCSRHEYGYWLDGRPLVQPEDGADGDGIAPNETGVLWYRMARSGYGFQSAKSGWEFAIKGVVRDARSVILSLITDYNVQEIMKLLYVWPQTEMEVKSDQGRDDLEDYKTGPDAMWVHGTDVRRIPTNAAQIPQWAFEIENLNTSMAEAHLGGRVLSGVDEQDTASGLRTRVGLAKAPTRATKKALENAVAGMLSDMLYIQKNVLDQPLMLPTATGYATFDVARVDDNIWIEVDLTPLSDEERAFKLGDLLKRKQAGVVSIRTVVHADPSIDDPDEELIEIDADRVMEQGDLMQAASAEALRRFQEQTGATEAPNPGALPGETSQVVTLGSPVDVGRQNAALNGSMAGVQPPPAR